MTGATTCDARPVIIVDDDPAFVEEITFTLCRSGYMAYGFQGGQDALIALLRAPSAVVLIDVNMPGWNGVRTALTMKALAPEATIIFITGDPDGLARAREGTDIALLTLQKPFQTEELERMIKGIAARTPVTTIDQRK